MDSRQIDIMGIINVTDDSYYPESRCLGNDGTPDIWKILSKAGSMLEEGAAILDIGACSTRPGSLPVREEEEWRRLRPALEAIFRHFPDVTVSIDTYRASVIDNAASLLDSLYTARHRPSGTGQHQDMPSDGTSAAPGHCPRTESQKEYIRKRLIINDISAGRLDPGMLPLAGRLGLRYIAMHMKGSPADMQQMCDYGNVTEDVIDYFREFAVRAAEAGITDWILDPGFGFAKTAEQNWQLMKELGRFSESGLFRISADSTDTDETGCKRDMYPDAAHDKEYHPRILVGISRKSMIYRMFGITPQESLPQTQVLHLAALERGASILRVHDVAEAARTVAAYRMLY